MESPESMAMALGGPYTRRSNGGVMALCPAHGDKNPSLAIDHGDNGNLVFKCFAGCDQQAIVAALKSRGLWDSLPHPEKVQYKPNLKATITPEWTAVIPVPENAPEPPTRHATQGEPSSVYRYLSESGELLYLVCRFDLPDGGKDVRPLAYFANSKSGYTSWRWQMPAEPRPLYGLDTLHKSGPVVIVEGEKAADAARRLLPDGVVLTWSGGCNAVSKSDWQPLKDKRVIVWPDSDEPGEKAAKEIIKQLVKVGAKETRIVKVSPDWPKGWDLADAEVEGWTTGDVEAYMDGAHEQEPEEEVSEDEVDEEKPSFDELIERAKNLTEDPDIAEVETLVMDAAYLSPLQKRKIHSTIKAQTKLPYSVLRAAESAGIDTPEEPDDLTLARDLVRVIGPDNILSVPVGVYRYQETGVWKLQEDRAIKQEVQRFVGDGEKLDSVRKSNIDSIAELFQTEIFIPEHRFNIGEPETVNCLNGALEYRPGEIGFALTPHKKEDFRTTQIPVRFDPDATAPRFVRFMQEIFQGDDDADDKSQALLEVIGYSLMAHCRHEIFVILVGAGANGKSVLLAIIEALCGPENVAGVQHCCLTNRSIK